MTKLTQIVTYQGRTYQLTTDEEKRFAPLLVYAQVHRVRKDGTIGRQITTGNIIYAVLQTEELV